ncbi:Ig-like domain-containing protein [Tenacibaculum amylolyticum]|uniref:Ig-like domain-containing protein n=1 Tax=Tenacibaculum amylolyticum TaxID=104269 RepID=UPI0038948318
MKKVIPFLVLILALQFIACSKDNEEPVNNPPVIENQTFSGSVSGALTFNVVASDPDNDTLTFSILQNSNNQFVISNNGVITKNGEAPTELGTHTLEVEVTDGTAKASATVTITLIESEA